MKQTSIDRATIEQATKGSISAFERIVCEYEKPVFFFSLRYVRNRHDAEDIVQEVFLKIFKNLSRFDLQKTFSTWIFAITQNTVFDWLRKRRRSREVLILDDPNFVFENYLLVKNETTKRNSHIDIGLAFRKLKPVYRSVINLFYQEGLEYSEISRKLNLPLNTVKTYLYRAKRSLRKAMS
ncbi:MAG TPA: sigma-70 family RNA polymerase sigma factor [bacterium]|nr:sigma-70 family RNA polymerase sigma factor [bacterium]